MNTAVDLLREADRLGVRLELDGGDIVAEGPLTDSFVEQLRRHKREVIAAMHGPSLDDLPDPSTATEPFNQEAMDAILRGQVVQVWSDLLGEWLYWVKSEYERKRLLAEGCRLPIYTLGELAVVVQHDPEDIKKLHTIKRTFNGWLRQQAAP